LDQVIYFELRIKSAEDQRHPDWPGISATCLNIFINRQHGQKSVSNQRAAADRDSESIGTNQHTEKDSKTAVTGSDLPCDSGVLVDASTGPPWRRSAHVRPPPGDAHELLRQHLPFVDGDLAAVDTPRDGRRPRGSSASGGIAVRFGLVLPGAGVSRGEPRHLTRRQRKSQTPAWEISRRAWEVKNLQGMGVPTPRSQIAGRRGRRR
jgi:hypothetical protein